MKLNLKIVFLAACLILIGGIFFISKIAAQDDPFAQLTYPIAELGNCADKESCGTYCDKAANMERCLNFAKDNNLMPEEDIEMGERMLALGETQGPGGCQGRRACENYCDEMAHIKECVAFAEKNNLIPEDELAEAKKVISAIDQGLTPPKCKGKKECDDYCSRPEDMEECITFAKGAGLMPPEEAKDAEKMLVAIKKGIKPPNCGGREACDAYCSQPKNMQECMEFALAAGFMPEGEIENAKKSLEAIKKGVNPPNCRGKEECDVYCSQLEHAEECLNFAEAAGFMSHEEAQQARKGGAVPGGCKTKEECEDFCQDPDNAEQCEQFVPGDEQDEGGEDVGNEEGDEQGVPQEGTRGLPQGFEGKCDSPDSCFQYCVHNFQDPACQSASGNPGGNMAPPPETTSPPPTEPQTQSLLQWTKKMLANILSSILGF